jgi:hypothetical protein
MLTPALAASSNPKQRRPAPSLRGGGFTPAVADPRLAAELARRGFQVDSFRFTPSAAAVGSKKNPIRVAVRARAATPAAALRAAAAETASTPVTAITPTAYNLGVSVGWKRFAVSGDVARITGGPVGAGRETAEVGVSYDVKRFTGRLEVGAARPDGTAPRIIGNEESYSVGVGGSFRLTRNLDVTGGVRYKIHRDRLETLEDNRRDSQAVYVGTAFRF